jgi:hypothetical protein
MPILGIIASSISGNLTAFNSIQTFTITSNTASVTFSGIPQTYKHLQIRGIAINPANGGFVGFRHNGDSSTSSYVQHFLYGNANGTAASSGNTTGQTMINCGGVSYGVSATNPRAFIVDILDYTNTNKYKTSKILTGEDENGAGEVAFQSGLWKNTAATTSLTFIVSNAFTPGSQIALYGVK